MSRAGQRVALTATAGAVAGADLAVKVWAERALMGGGIEGGPVDLVLGYNTGVAFSLGAGVPTWTVLALTAAITLAVAAFAWRVAGSGGLAQLTALALVLGGAVANLADRAADGRVTDYLHTGWWPTFNLADVAIVTGGLLLAVATWQAGATRDGAAESAPGRAPRPDAR